MSKINKVLLLLINLFLIRTIIINSYKVISTSYFYLPLLHKIWKSNVKKKSPSCVQCVVYSLFPPSVTCAQPVPSQKPTSPSVSQRKPSSTFVDSATDTWDPHGLPAIGTVRSCLPSCWRKLKDSTRQRSSMLASFGQKVTQKESKSK